MSKLPQVWVIIMIISASLSFDAYTPYSSEVYVWEKNALIIKHYRYFNSSLEIFLQFDGSFSIYYKSFIYLI